MGRGQPIKCKYLTSTYETSWRKRGSLSPLSLSGLLCGIARASHSDEILCTSCGHLSGVSGYSGSLRAPDLHPPRNLLPLARFRLKAGAIGQGVGISEHLCSFSILLLRGAGARPMPPPSCCFSRPTVEISPLQAVFLGGGWAPSSLPQRPREPCRNTPSASMTVAMWVSTSLPSPWVLLASVAMTITLTSSRCASDRPGPASPRLQGHVPRSPQASQMPLTWTEDQSPPVGGRGVTPQHTSQPFQRHSLPLPRQHFSSLGEEG